MYIKKQQQLFFISFLFLVFLYVGLFYVPITPALSAGLEITYPTIAGQTIGANGTTPELPAYLKYLFVAGTSIGFFAVFIGLVIAGIFYIISPAKPDLRAQAKERVTGAISGLLIIVLTYLIITTINPQLNIFNINKLPTTTIQAKKEDAGVYFYSTASDCPDKAEQIRTTSSISDLGDNKNKITTVNIVQGSDYYISILYDNSNFWGKCQLFPTEPCQSALDLKTKLPFADSASVYKYTDSPNGDGVYFYRKSYFNDKGGWIKIDNGMIKDSEESIYVGDLNGLSFTGLKSKPECNVPESEQDCTKYDPSGECSKGGRKCPNLAGENISSIKIAGDYIVMLVYFDQHNDSAMSWSSCQEFPTPDDVNQAGPQQIKWKNIRNTNQVIPNFVVIIPIKR